MILAVKWRLSSGESFEANSSYQFSSSYTDYGFCCKIFPQLDFENELTKNIDVSEYKSKHFYTFNVSFWLRQELNECLYISVRPAQTWLKHSILIILAQIFKQSSKGHASERFETFMLIIYQCSIFEIGYRLVWFAVSHFVSKKSFDSFTCVVFFQ